MTISRIWKQFRLLTWAASPSPTPLKGGVSLGKFPCKEPKLPEKKGRELDGPSQVLGSASTAQLALSLVIYDFWDLKICKTMEYHMAGFLSKPKRRVGQMLPRANLFSFWSWRGRYEKGFLTGCFGRYLGSCATLANLSLSPPTGIQSNPEATRNNSLGLQYWTEHMPWNWEVASRFQAVSPQQMALLAAGSLRVITSTK